MSLKLDLVKPIWKCSANNSLQVPKFELQHETLGKLKISVYNKSNNINTFFSRIRNSNDEVLGVNTFGVNPESNKLLGFFMETDINHRGQGIGELLRLISVMILDKNKNKAIDIYSKEQAIYFHAKYKFQPHITNFLERNFALADIAADKNQDVKQFSKKAKELLDKINASNDPEYLRRINVTANKYINSYIKNVMDTKSQKKHQFSNGFAMELTSDNVSKNKLFFNSLFKKQGIDYEL